MVDAIHHTVESHHLRQLRIGTVDRQPGHSTQRSNRLAHTICHHEWFVDVLRVGQGARQRAIDEVVALHASLQRGGKDEHLHARTGLTATHREVDLVLPRLERFATHHRSNRPRRVVHGDQCGLGVHAVVRHQRDCLISRRLNFAIEGRVDAQTTAEQLGVPLLICGAEDGGLVQEVVLHQLGEVRSLHRLVGPAANTGGQHVCGTSDDFIVGESDESFVPNTSQCRDEA